ncbi:hypothetical protein MicloDRAFT_00004410 [Microvirga lotononidis]|uniref:Uncharacterized protein n=1 Tax=Microvirga lotononidis TaxID=864069 RepID=I4Z3X2_9HYPH|nr:hypothetical protein MicloDRAFT_00004410 [Microvirga lotononidis]
MECILIDTCMSIIVYAAQNRLGERLVEPRVHRSIHFTFIGT